MAVSVNAPPTRNRAGSFPLITETMYQNRQAYAPTPHSYIPNTTLSATINLDEVSFSASFSDKANNLRKLSSPKRGQNEICKILLPKSSA